MSRSSLTPPTARREAAAAQPSTEGLNPAVESGRGPSDCLTPAEVLEIDRQNILAMAESGGRLAARIGKPREWNSYPDNGLHDEQREAWFRGYDAERAL